MSQSKIIIRILMLTILASFHLTGNSQPTVTGVSGTDGTYKTDDILSILIVFSDSVDVDEAGGTPYLELETGTTNRNATYSSGTGNDSLIFTYVVQTGDESNALDYTSTNALDLNGGTIKATSDGTTDADITLATPGDPGSLSDNSTIVIDGIAPAAPSVSDISSGDYNSDQTFTVTGDGSSTLEYSLDNGGSWQSYTSSVTLSAEDTYDVVARQTDAAGNVSPSSSVITVTIDKTSPGVPTVTGISEGSYNTDQTFTVSGELGASIEYSLDNGSSWAIFSSDVTISSEGIYDVVARQTDAAGNKSSNSTAITVEIDKSAPAAPSVNGISAGTYNTDQSFTISGELGASFEYSLDDGNNWLSYSAEVTLSSEDTYEVLARQTDEAGNLSVNSSTIIITIDKTSEAPALTKPETNGADNALIDLSFSLPEDALPGSVKLTFLQTDGNNDPRTHIITFSSAYESSGTHTGTLEGANLSTSANVSSVSSDENDYLIDGAFYEVTLQYQDSHDNPVANVINTGFAYEANPPEPDILDVTPDPRNTNAGIVTVSFDKFVQVSTVDITDFILTLDTDPDNDPPLPSSIDMSGLSVNPVSTENRAGIDLSNEFTLNLSTVTTNEGLYVLSIDASETDIISQGGVQIQDDASDTWTNDRTSPTVSSIALSNPATSPTNSSGLTYKVIFDEPVNNVDNTDFTLTTTGSFDGSATIDGFGPSSGTDFFVTVSSVNGDGTVRLDLNNSGTGIVDDAGNAISDGFTSGGVYAIDQTPPIVNSILLDTPATSPTNADVLIFKVTFSEIAYNIDIDDFSLNTTNTASGSVSAVSASSGTVIDVTVSSVSGDGDLRLDLKGSGTGIEDHVGNLITTGYSAGSEYLIDNTSPVPAISSTESDPTNASPISLVVTFNEDVNGFVDSDLDVTGLGLISGFSGADDSYSFNFTPSADGQITFGIQAGTSFDDAGNSNSAAANFTINSDQTAPEINAVSIESDNSNDQYVGVGGVVKLIITGSEDIDLQTGDVLIAGQQATLSGSGKNWTASYTMQSTDAEGDVSFQLNYNDLAGNAGATVTSTTDASSVDFDKTPPTLALTSPPINIVSDNSNNTSFAKAGDNITLTFKSSDNNELLKNVEVLIEGKSAVITTLDSLAFKAEYTMPATGIPEGVLDFTIDFQDLAGNDGVQVTSTSDGSQVTYDPTAPEKPKNIKLVNDLGLYDDDGITGSTNVNFFGEAEAYSSVNLYSNIDDYLGAVTASDTATFEFSVSLSEGAHSITATATDGSGNISPVSLSLSVRIDTTRPAKPDAPSMDGN
ncbi:MAG TPA: Ig-like domain-containing protein, partial [Bacteroidales bacterium]|nr:Ig-like domain-containing protein [Bacteroidales bacterium]